MGGLYGAAVWRGGGGGCLSVGRAGIEPRSRRLDIEHPTGTAASAPSNAVVMLCSGLRQLVGCLLVGGRPRCAGRRWWSSALRWSSAVRRSSAWRWSSGVRACLLVGGLSTMPIVQGLCRCAAWRIAGAVGSILCEHMRSATLPGAHVCNTQDVVWSAGSAWP